MKETVNWALEINGKRRREKERELDVLLLSLLRRDAIEERELFVGQVSALLERATTHGTSVLLSVKLAGAADLDRQVRKEVVRIYTTAALKDIQLTKQLSRLVQELHGAGIRFLVFKGPMLWRALLLGHPVRISEDIDILVRPAERERTDKILESMGYSCLERDPHEACYATKDIPTTIDLHWSFLTTGGWGDRLDILLSEAWSNAVSIKVGEIQIPTLGPTDTILYLALHSACHHVCMDWTAMYEIARGTIVWNESINWEHLALAAGRMGIRSAIYWPLFLSQKHFAAEIPDDILRKLRPPVCRLGLRWLALAGFFGRFNPKNFRAARAVWNLISQSGLRSLFGWSLQWLRHHIIAWSKSAN